MRRRPNRPYTLSKASRVPAAPFRCRLVVMVKVPEMGRVKTRLARQVGAVEAVRFYRQTVRSILARVGRDARWQTSLSIAPDLGLAHPFLPSSLRRKRQGRGDLGERMQHVMDEADPGPVVIIGTDIPAIRPSHIARAFALLRRGDAVFGPAPDGGYWLVGLKRCPRVRKIFSNVQWSSTTTLEDTIANLEGAAVAKADVLSDVDSADDLGSCYNWFGRRVLPVAIGRQSVCHASPLLVEACLRKDNRL